MFTLTIETDNAAFERRAQAEVARILRKLASRIEGNTDGLTDDGKLMDVNGNTVGTWTYTPLEDSDPYKRLRQAGAEGRPAPWAGMED